MGRVWYLQASYTPFWGKKMYACTFINLKMKRNYKFWIYLFIWGEINYKVYSWLGFQKEVKGLHDFLKVTFHK